MSMISLSSHIFWFWWIRVIILERLFAYERNQITHQMKFRVNRAFWGTTFTGLISRDKVVIIMFFARLNVLELNMLNGAAVGFSYMVLLLLLCAEWLLCGPAVAVCCMGAGCKLYGTNDAWQLYGTDAEWYCNCCLERLNENDAATCYIEMLLLLLLCALWVLNGFANVVCCMDAVWNRCCLNGFAFGLNLLICGLIGPILLLSWLNGLNKIHIQPFGLNKLICGLIGLILLLCWLNGLNKFQNQTFGIIELICGLIGLIVLLCWLNGLNKIHIQHIGLNLLFYGLYGCCCLNFFMLYGDAAGFSCAVWMLYGTPATWKLYGTNAVWKLQLSVWSNRNFIIQCAYLYVIQDNIADRFRMIVTLRIGYLVSYFWSPKPVSGDDRGVCPPYVV